MNTSNSEQFHDIHLGKQGQGKHDRDHILLRTLFIGGFGVTGPHFRI